MSATPRVLALVPHLRSEPGLEHCLTSLTAQSRRLDHIVVLDDATPEPPVDVVRLFPTVTLWRAPQPLGLRRLLWRAVACTRFDWYLLADPEGWSSPQRLERLLEHAESAEVGLVGGRVLIFGPSGATTTYQPRADVAALGVDSGSPASSLLASLARRDVLARMTADSGPDRHASDSTDRSGPSSDLHIAPHVLSFRGGRSDPAPVSSTEASSRAVPEPVGGRRSVAWLRLAGPRVGTRWRWPVLRRSSSATSSLGSVDGPVPSTAEPLPTSRPRFVGGAASGAEPLFWALAQHPTLRAVVDASWVLPLAETAAALLADVISRSSADPAARSGGTRVGELVRRTAVDFSALAGGDRDPWIARLAGDPSSLDAAPVLFPGARVLHVVEGSPANGPIIPGQLLQITDEDVIKRGDETVERSLSFLGLPPHRSCTLALAAAVEALRDQVRPTGAEGMTLAGTGGQVPDHLIGPLHLLRDLPPKAVVAAVTKGDGALDAAAGVEVRHFPQTADGEWTGYHPADTGDILRQLRTLPRRGVTHFLLPAWSAWWLDHYDGLRQGLETVARPVAQSADGGHLYRLLPDERRSPRSAPRRSVTVIAWDTSHNPLGRAHVLAELLSDRYDVEIVGARFPSFGSTLWRPLRDADMPIRTFPGLPFPDFVQEVERFACTITSDALLVSKPRLPSLALGLLAAVQRPRPVLLDVDDRELTFVGASEPLELRDLEHLDDSELSNPYGRQWTRVCESLVGLADEVTVSNVALQQLLGGTIIPHARDERLFDPSTIDRQDARRVFGFAPDDRVVLFGGTPRRHKGVVELAAAVHALGDPKAKLCLIATDELRELRRHLAPYADVLVEVPYQPFERLPHLLAAVDAVAVLQDPQSEVSDFQMPAKITDALAMQLPCIVREVPPLAPLVAQGHLIVVGPDGLSATLEWILSDLDGARERARSSRELFLQEYSFSAARPRLEDLVESVLSRPSEPRPGIPELVDVLRERGLSAASSRESR